MRVDLKAAESHTYSHAGRDGVLQKIFEVIEPTSRFVFEFGAANGIRASNSRRFILHEGWRALLIEYADKLAEQCKQEYRDNSRVTVVHAPTTPDNIVALMQTAGVPEDIDLITVDIDCYDFYVWKKIVGAYKPKVVMVEINTAFPPPIRCAVPYIPENLSHNQKMLGGPQDDFYGASLQMYCDLNTEQGYALVHIVENDAFFVRQEFCSRFGLEDNSPETLYIEPAWGGRSRLPGSYRRAGRAPNGKGHIPSRRWEEMGLL